MRKNRGYFITFEGGEGAGKTTLITSIANDLKEKGFEVLVTREPGGSDLGEKIRSLLLDSKGPMTPQAELCLFLASRSQHLSEKILPALKESKVVLCDRFNDSSIAYQGFGRGLAVKQVEEICNTICKDIKPDLTFYLDLSPQEGLNRIQESHDRIESEKKSFHEKVRLGYIELSKKEPGRIKVIDASLSKEKVFENALNELNSTLLKLSSI